VRAVAVSDANHTRAGETARLAALLKVRVRRVDHFREELEEARGGGGKRVAMSVRSRLESGAHFEPASACHSSGRRENLGI
jgi:hypothetical protein